MTETIPTYYTLAEAAQIMRLSTRTVRSYLLSGKLKGDKTPGGHWRIREDALRELMQSGTSLNDR